jgi:hypothetical protein
MHPVVDETSLYRQNDSVDDRNDGLISSVIRLALLPSKSEEYTFVNEYVLEGGENVSCYFC